MKTKQTLTICDLNAAVVAISDVSKRHTEKCLLAQFAQRITGKEFMVLLRRQLPMEVEVEIL